MEYNIYLDVYFIQNFIMNVFLLISCRALMKNGGTGKRILLAAALGSLGACLVLFIQITIPGRGILAGSMVFVLYGRQNRRSFLMSFLCIYIVSFAMEGAIRFSKSWVGVAMVVLICFLIGKERKEKLREITVILTFKGRTKRLKGFYDTGNRLMEPLTGRMVHIASYKAVKELLPEPYCEIVEDYFETGFLESTKVTKLQMYEFTFLSYHSIGKETGQLLGIRMDSAVYQGDAGEKTEEKAVIALTNQKLFVDDRCQLILNGRLEL